MTPRKGFALRATGAVVLLGFVLTRAKLADLHLPAGGALLGAIGGAAALLAAALVLSALRWWLVLGPGVAPWAVLVRLYFVGQFFSLFLPTSVGGDAVRVLALSRATQETGRALSSVLIERLLGVGALVAYLVAGASLTPSLLLTPLHRLTWRVGWQAGVGVLGAVSVGWWLVRRYWQRWPRLVGLARAWGEASSRLRGSPRLSGAAALAALAIQATYIFSWYVIALLIHLDLPLRALLVLVPFVSLAAMLPVTLSGLGVREGVWALLLQPLGVSSVDAVGFSLLFYLANLLVGAVGGVVYMMRGAGIAPLPVEAAA